MQTDGQTDMTKPIVAFRNFVNAPKNAQTFGTSLPLTWQTFIAIDWFTLSGWNKLSRYRPEQAHGDPVG